MFDHANQQAMGRAVRDTDPEVLAFLARYQSRVTQAPEDGIRSFRPEDREQFWNLGNKALRTARTYRGLKAHKQTVLYALYRCMMDPFSGHVFVAQNDGKVTGMLVARADTWWWAHEHLGPRYAYSMLTYSERPGDGRRLLEAFEEWAWLAPRVVMIEDDISSGRHTDATIALYRSMGFELSGTVLVKRHPDYDNRVKELAQ